MESLVPTSSFTRELKVGIKFHFDNLLMIKFIFILFKVDG